MTRTGSVRTTYKGKKTTFSARKLKSGKVGYYVGGKKATKHQTRLVRSLLNQKAEGLKPTIAAARGHAGEYSTAPKRRRAFYKRYDGAFITMREIRQNELLSLGTVVINGKKIKRTWAAPWKTAKIRKRYDWYAIVTCYPVVDESGRVGSPDSDLDWFDEEDQAAMAEQDRAFQDVVVPLKPDGVDVTSEGFYMDEIIEGFEQNLWSVLLSERFQAIPADRDTMEPITSPEEVGRCVVALFRHRYDPALRKRRK